MKISFLLNLIITIVVIQAMNIFIAVSILACLSVHANDTPEYEFSMNGPSLKQVAFGDPAGAYFALEIMYDTQTKAAALKLKGKQFEKFRHMYFSARLSQLIGAVRCQKFTNAYERFIPNSKLARDFDLENNEEGRKIGLLYTTYNDQQLVEHILRKL